MSSTVRGLVISEDDEIGLRNLVSALRAMARPIEESGDNDNSVPITPTEMASLIYLAADDIEVRLERSGFTTQPANVRL